MNTVFILFWAAFSQAFRAVAGNKNQEYSGSQFIANRERLKMSIYWLNELEETYKIGFPKQFGLMRHRNLSTVPNHNSGVDKDRTCQNVSSRSVDQNIRLIDHYGYDYVLNLAIDGDTENYHFTISEREGFCSEIRQLKRRVKSVFPFGKCVRLFQEWNCRGWSLAIYPGSANYYRIELPRHVTFRWIGPCFKNEFLSGYFNETSPNFLIKNPKLRSFNPDLLMLLNPDIKFNRQGFGFVHFKYSVGPGNRTEIIEATPRGYEFITRPEVNVEERNFHKSFEKEDGDVLGHAVPTSLGGPATEAINLFPANPATLDEWNDLLLSYMKEASVRGIHLQFEYENGNKTRPLSFYYWILSFNYSDSIIEYGRIINGHQENLTRGSPYAQVIPTYEYKCASTVNLSDVLELYGSKTLKSFFGNTSIQNFNEIPALSLYSCKQAQVTRGLDLDINFKKSFCSTDIFQEMIKNPMVRVFSGENYTGDFEDYHLGIGKLLHRCYYNTQVLKNVKSAVTFGKCVRLFEQRFCQGLSLAIYGTSGISNQTAFSILSEVQSIGPCFDDEFINASFCAKEKGQVVKDSDSSLYLPDLLQFAGFNHLNKKLELRRCQLFMNYDLGPRNRIEFLNIKISWILPTEEFVRGHYPKIVDKGDTKLYDTFDRKSGDVLSYVIPVELCAPRNESFNMFPMNQYRVDDWARMFPSFYYDPGIEFGLNVELHFVYENNNTNRPRFVYYYIWHLLTGKLYYGRFINFRYPQIHLK